MKTRRWRDGTDRPPPRPPHPKPARMLTASCFAGAGLWIPWTAGLRPVRAAHLWIVCPHKWGQTPHRPRPPTDSTDRNRGCRPRGRSDRLAGLWPAPIETAAPPATASDGCAFRRPTARQKLPPTPLGARRGLPALLSQQCPCSQAASLRIPRLGPTASRPWRTRDLPPAAFAAAHGYALSLRAGTRRPPANVRSTGRIYICEQVLAGGLAVKWP